LKLREVTRKVIASLEEKSGYTTVTEAPALPTLATTACQGKYSCAYSFLQAGSEERISGFCPLLTEITNPDKYLIVINTAYNAYTKWEVV
jgi:hypothetical protein